MIVPGTDNLQRLGAIKDLKGCLSGLFAHAPVGMAVVGPQGEMLLVNRAFRETFGSEFGTDFTIEDRQLSDQVNLRDMVQRSFQRETITTPVFWYTPSKLRTLGRSAGLEIAISLTTFPVYGGGGQVQYVVAVTSNHTAEVRARERAEAELTQRKQLESALKETNQQLEARVAELVSSNSRLQSFAYAASHDLQTPLRTVGNFLQMIQRTYEDSLDEQGVDWINRAVQGADRLQRLIHGLLHYSRMDANTREFEPVSMTKVFDHVIADLEATICESQAQITHDNLPGVMGVPSLLVQLLTNLISNGIKYQAHDTPRVHVSASCEGDQWLFSVRDNGIGIDTRNKERIFGLFRRLHVEREYPGLGIGLAVCRRIIEHHHGRIWVESEPGAGSVFYFTLSAQKGA